MELENRLHEVCVECASKKFSSIWPQIGLFINAQCSVHRFPYHLSFSMERTTE